jgi:hypothetical protein
MVFNPKGIVAKSPTLRGRTELRWVNDLGTTTPTWVVAEGA